MKPSRTNTQQVGTITVGDPIYDDLIQLNDLTLARLLEIMDGALVITREHTISDVLWHYRHNVFNGWIEIELVVEKMKKEEEEKKTTTGGPTEVTFTTEVRKDDE